MTFLLNRYVRVCCLKIFGAVLLSFGVGLVIIDVTDSLIHHMNSQSIAGLGKESTGCLERGMVA